MTLYNAKEIYRSATRKMQEKEMDNFMQSTDYLEQEFTRSYRNLVSALGKHRASEIAQELIQLPF